jgi:hypothetical protein
MPELTNSEKESQWESVEEDLQARVDRLENKYQEMFGG